MSGVMIVTGGGRGIGAAVARMAGAGGYKVCVNYSRAKAKADQVVQDIVGGGGEAIAVRADVGVESEIVAMFEETDRALGPVTALVSNAGIDYETRIADLELPRYERVFAVNITGPVLCAREAVRRMSTERGGEGGVIVHVSSISSRTGGLPRDVVYTATKGAMDSFTHGLAKEVGPEGIRVVSVRPGITRTEIFDGNEFGLEQAIELAKTVAPLQRIGEPEEVAAMVLWLCSDAASYVTGTTFDVSGGR